MVLGMSSLENVISTNIPENCIYKTGIYQSVPVLFFVSISPHLKKDKFGNNPTFLCTGNMQMFVCIPLI